MVANCVKVRYDVYTTPDGNTIPMVVAYLDVPDSNDLVKVQVSQKRVQGEPKDGQQVYVDCAPRYSQGGKMYWKPSLLRFFPEGQAGEK